MYFVANKGNSLYVSSMRLVTSLDLIFERLDQERIKRLKEGVRHKRLLDKYKEGLTEYIKAWGGPVVYQMDVDTDKPPFRITKQQLISLAEEWESKPKVIS